MDEIDRVQEEALQLQQDLLLQRFRLGIRNAMYGSELFCCVCGAEIPAERRQAARGCTRCLACQERHEILTHWR